MKLKIDICLLVSFIYFLIKHNLIYKILQSILAIMEIFLVSDSLALNYLFSKITKPYLNGGPSLLIQYGLGYLFPIIYY